METIRQSDKLPFTVSGSPYAPIGSPAALDLPSPRESASARPVFPFPLSPLLFVIILRNFEIIQKWGPLDAILLSSCHSERATASRRIRFLQYGERIPPRASLGRNDIFVSLNDIELWMAPYQDVTLCSGRSPIKYETAAPKSSAQRFAIRQIGIGKLIVPKILSRIFQLPLCCEANEHFQIHLM